jgi:hypothetical protein
MNLSSQCHPNPKWFTQVNDSLVFAPQEQVRVRILKDQASIPDDHALVRDHGSQHDVLLDDDAIIDLAEGNVFFTVPKCDYQPKSGCIAAPKLAWFVNDRAEITLKPDQTGQTIRDLFSLSDCAPLIRDFESPNDVPIGLGDTISFEDGPVFYSRQEQHPTEIKIIVNGREVSVTGATISYSQVVAIAYPQVDADTICTVTYKRGHPSKPEGSMVNGDVVKLNCGMIFNVTPTRKS